MLILLLCLNLYLLTEAKFLTKIEYFDGGKRIFAYKEPGNDEDWSCVCVYTNSYNSTGWDQFQVQTRASDSNKDQAYCAGYIEGLYHESIYIHYFNTVKNWKKNLKKKGKKLYKKFKEFVETHMDWVENQISGKAASDAIWAQVAVFYNQIRGMYDSYNVMQIDPKRKLELMDLIMMNLQTDLDDVMAVIVNDTSAKLNGDTRCSALIKVLSNNTDIVMGHATWNGYSAMYRMVKKYNMFLNTTSSSGKPVPGSSISFSGYPGVISSVDDFYITNNNLVAMETTIDNNNASLWQYVEPTGQLFESVRAMAALRLGLDGKSWCKTFSQYNSGTYNNQWMIVDLKKFKKGSAPKPGTLWVLEQIPGYVRYEDQTSRLVSQGYWPSYNVPFYEDIFNMSGNQQLVDQYGDWFSYNNTPRALIFKRDQGTVVDVDTLMMLLRSNNYTKDPYSVCTNCTPPYNAENAIASRSDLNPKNGHYPFPALGHRAHGATDAKVTSSSLAANLTFKAVCGPTTGAGLPPFSWKGSNFHIPHIGQPDMLDFPISQIIW